MPTEHQNMQGDEALTTGASWGYSYFFNW
jgi:hypothetical protein